MSAVISTLLRRASRPLLLSTSFSSSPPLIPSSFLLHCSNHQHLPPPNTHNLVPSLFFSSSSSKKQDKPQIDVNDNLLHVLHSEIQTAVDSHNPDKSYESPSGFPFEIVDIAGSRSITLRRQFNGEIIEVQVDPSDDIEGLDPQKLEKLAGSDYSGGEDNDAKNSGNWSVFLLISIKKEGRATLEFGCAAFYDDFAIHSFKAKELTETSIGLKYEGPRFVDLDVVLQQSFFKYLELRGLSSSITPFLHDYLMNKDNQEYVRWLTDIKEFTEKQPSVVSV